MEDDIRAEVEQTDGPFVPTVDVAHVDVMPAEPAPARGGHDTVGMTQAEVAAVLGVSVARVQQIEAKALRKVRKAWLAAYGDPFPRRPNTTPAERCEPFYLPTFLYLTAGDPALAMVTE